MRLIRTPVTAGAAAATLALVLTACSPAADPAQENVERATADPSPEETMSAALMPMGTGDPFSDAKTAAGRMTGSALTLATGLGTATGTTGEVDSDAADLRAGFTALLQEHTYLAGYAVATAYVAGPDSEAFAAAAAALDENSVAVSEAVTSLAGEEKGAAFLTTWREHIGYFVDYALAAKAGDEAGKAAAIAELDEYRMGAGVFFEEVSGGTLPAAAVEEQLAGHVSTLSAAIDALAAGDPASTTRLQEAANHASMMGTVLAGGFDTALDIEGDPMDDASTLRTGMTQLLQEHVYLAGLAVFNAYTAEGGLESPAFTTAAETLDANSVAISEAVTSLAGEEKGAEFLETWREHIGYFVDYAAAKAGGDDMAAEMALEELAVYAQETGVFFDEVSGGELPADAVEEDLRMHIESLAGAIDSLAGALVS